MSLRLATAKLLRLCSHSKHYSIGDRAMDTLTLLISNEVSPFHLN